VPFFELIPSGTHIDFLGRRRICIMISLALIALGIGVVIVDGVPMGIDFAGGTEIQVRFDDGIDTNEAALREVVRTAGYQDATVVRFGEEGTKDYLIRFKADPEEIAAGLRAGKDAAPENGAETVEADTAKDDSAKDSPATGETTKAEGAKDKTGEEGLVANTRVILLEKAIREHIGGFTEQRVEFVGPKVGEELRADGAKALLLSAIAILIYIAFRFNSRFAPGAVVAVIHDLLITFGLLILFGVEFDLRILAALLAILGYSLNDTIIIYDRIRENLEVHTSADLVTVLNDSVNQTLSRTVLTSMTTMIAVLALYLLGGDVIRPFALAMLIGIFVGTYSSIFIASPMLLFLEERYRMSHAPSGKAIKSNRSGSKGQKGRK
jgi:preprotein translocase subunit SecF